MQCKQCKNVWGHTEGYQNMIGQLTNALLCVYVCVKGEGMQYAEVRFFNAIANAVSMQLQLPLQLYCIHKKSAYFQNVPSITCLTCKYVIILRCWKCLMNCCPEHNTSATPLITAYFTLMVSLVTEQCDQLLPLLVTLAKLSYASSVDLLSQDLPYALRPINKSLSFHCLCIFIDNKTLNKLYVNLTKELQQ